MAELAALGDQAVFTVANIKKDECVYVERKQSV